MEPESSGGILPAPTGPQQPQPLADAGTSPSKPGPLKTFYKGEPLALGITQILIGILSAAFGAVISCMEKTHYSPYILFQTPYWTGALYIISGSLSVAAAKNPRIALVKGMLGVNVASAVAAILGLLFFALASDRFLPAHAHFHRCPNTDPEIYQRCYEMFTFLNVQSGVVMILLAFAIIEFGLAITTAAFGCAVVCRDTYDEKIVVVYQKAAQDSPVNFPPAEGTAETV